MAEITTNTPTTKPTILLVQGSFQTTSVYDPLVKRLESLGYPTVHPPLPSCTNTEDPAFPSITLIDDALVIRIELIRHIEYGGELVVVVMHSYGGLVGSEAIPEELSYQYRRTRGLPGGVVHLYYFTAFIIPPGKSVLESFGESPMNDVKPDGRFTIKNGASILYNDLPEADAARLESQLIPQSHKVQTIKLTRGAYQYIPSTYLVCTNDQAVPVQYQEMFAASAGAQLVDRCNSGHSAMLSQTELLADKISAAAEKAAGEARSKDSAMDSQKTIYLMTRSTQVDERSRLDLQHQVWLLTLEERLYTVALPANFNSVLDIGCGTGVWSIAMAALYPHVQVTATDLNLPMGIIPPENLTFIQADADTTWPLGQFSFIHGRMLNSGIHNWSKFLTRCWEHLEPGGVLELLDLCHPFRAEVCEADNTSSAFIRFGHAAEKSWAKAGLDYRAGTKHCERLRSLGFVNVDEKELKWPLGEWAETKRAREIGKMTLDNFQTFLGMAGVKILTSDPGLAQNEAQELVAAATKDLVENCVKNRFFLNIKIHTAHKPPMV